MFGSTCDTPSVLGIIRRYYCRGYEAHPSVVLIIGIFNLLNLQSKMKNIAKMRVHKMQSYRKITKIVMRLYIYNCNNATWYKIS